MSTPARNGQGFVAGSLIGTLGGLIGLGGAEFRLPVLVGVFRFNTLEAVILNKAMSLVVVAAALLFRGGTIAPGTLANHLDVVLNLLAGSLVGAWWAAGHAITLSRQWLNRIIMVLLVGLALVMLSEAWAGVHEGSTPLFEAGPLRFVAGLVAGLGIGMVAALLGVAGGELLIPVIVLLYGVNQRPIVSRCQRPNLSSLSGRFDGFFSLFEAEGIVAGFEDFAVMGDAVEQGGCHFWIAEHGHPFTE